MWRQYRRRRRAVFITGMSGSGKSAVCRALAVRGHRVVDTELPEWSTAITHPDGSGDHVWRELEIRRLLDEHHEGFARRVRLHRRLLDVGRRSQRHSSSPITATAEALRTLSN